MENTKKGYLLMLGFCFFSSISFLCVDAAFRMDSDLTPANGIFWGFLGTYCLSSVGLVSSKFRHNLKKEFITHHKLIAIISVLSTIGALFWFWAMKESNSNFVFYGKKQYFIRSIIRDNLFTRKILLARNSKLINYVNRLFFISNFKR